MKAQQIKITAIFEPDGKITPAKFIVNDMDTLLWYLIRR